MENQMSHTISTVSDEDYDEVFVFKLFNNPSLLDSLKSIERPEIFSPLKELINIDLLKVCIMSLILLQLYMFFFKFKLNS